jgi:hypothetical protein
VIAVPEGAKVFVHHFRVFKHVANYRTRGEALRLNIDWPPESKGGLTSVQVVLAGGRIVVGFARCSNRDNYCKAIGRQIALGRALKKLAA